MYLLREAIGPKRSNRFSRGVTVPEFRGVTVPDLYKETYSHLFVCFVALRPNQQLWSWPDGQFT